MHYLSLILQLHKPILRDQKEKVVGEKVSYMGIINGQPEPEIHHFSHQHPLQPSRLPQQITHPFDQNHTLSLLPKPLYPEGLFNCDACGKEGNSFSYHCGLCNIDLHTTCASMPLMLSHQSHYHQLNLTFSSPDDNKSFSCDICMEQLGVKQWRYRCSLCDFDAHLGCATANPRPPLTQNCLVPASAHYQVLGNQSQTGPLMQNYMAPRAGPQFQTRSPVQNHVNYAHLGSYGSVGPIGSRQRNGMLNQAIKGISESLGQTLVQRLLGGGSGSNGFMNTSGGNGSDSEGGIFWGSTDNSGGINGADSYQDYSSF